MTGSIRERLEAIRRELDALDFGSEEAHHQLPVASPGSALDKSPSASPSAVSDRTKDVGRSAWERAIDVAALRDRRRAQSLDSSVRALAREVGCSRGRAGELLQISDAFPRDVLILLGKGCARRGEELLSRLPYRQLRRVLAIESRMTMTRVFAVRDMGETRPDLTKPRYASDNRADS